MKRLLIAALLVAGCGSHAASPTVIAADPDPRPSIVVKFSPSPVPSPVVSRKPRASRERVVVVKPTVKPTVQKVVATSSVGLPEVMLRVRSCESGPNGYATGGRAHDYDYSLTNPASTASGAWQFLDSTWHYVTGLPGRAKDYSRSIQDRAAMKLYRSKEHLRPWAASKSCWGR